MIWNTLKLCEQDYESITTSRQHILPREISKQEILEDINPLNKGKSEDLLGLSVENIVYAGPELIYFLHILVNHIFLKELIPAVKKIGLMSPVYKNNREKHDTKNYRGIVVLPC